MTEQVPTKPMTQAGRRIVRNDAIHLDDVLATEAEARAEAVATIRRVFGDEAATIAALCEALATALGPHYDARPTPTEYLEARRVLDDTAASAEEARQRIVKDWLSEGAQWNDTRRLVITEWLASPEAERRLAAILHEAQLGCLLRDATMHPEGPPCDPDVGAQDAWHYEGWQGSRAILAALREQPMP